MTRPTRLARLAALLGLGLFAMSGGHAVGSTAEPGDELGTTVRNACVALAAPRMSVGTVRVDPVGTSTFGVAVLTDATTGAEHVCVYDKASGRTELGGPLEMVTDPAKPFSPQDATELSKLRAQVQATLAEIAEKGLPSNGEATTVAALLDGSVPPDALASFPAGTYRCTVFWYGFLDEGAREVGSHLCTVSKSETGGLVIDKTTGDRLHAETAPWERGLTAYYGRTFLDGQKQTRYDPAHPANRENANYGNKVGMVVRSDERLFLVSIDERGMTEPDPTYFEILELVPQF